MAIASYETVLEQAQHLTSEEQVRLIEALSHSEAEHTPVPRESLYGIVAHLGSAPSTEEIDEARHEMWASFLPDDPDAASRCGHPYREMKYTGVC